MARTQSSSEHLELLLLNLTVFSVRASDGALPVRVRVRCEEEPNAPSARRLVLAVCASGRAMSAEQVAAAFEPYTQDSTIAGATQSRLGLHVSRRLVEGAPPREHAFAACTHPQPSKLSVPSPRSARRASHHL